MANRDTDIRPIGATLYFLPVQTRMPLKFGAETVTYVTCARAAVTVEDAAGRRATGWGETPLSVQWVWPSDQSYELRHEALQRFTRELGREVAGFNDWGHPMELGWELQESTLPRLRSRFTQGEEEARRLPYLAALLCLSVYDIALHDAFGVMHGVDVYQTYSKDWMSRDLGRMMHPAPGAEVSFDDRFPADYLLHDPPTRLRAWHLVGGLDPLTEDDLTGNEPDDGYPVLLGDWIERDALKCLKIKLRGTDREWDMNRLRRVGELAIAHGVDWLSADFNCTVTDPAYVNGILDELRDTHPRLYGMILYVEQPFPYDLNGHRLDVHSVSARKPLFLDESAHDWRYVQLGRSLGWSGVALKTCKTQTGALLSLCWARAHGMPLMVQDLTNPMLAQVPHCRLAAHAGTIQGVETNAMQFYPEASTIEAAVHPGLYQRQGGGVDLSTLGGPGFGYRLNAIGRELPEPAGRYGETY